MGYSTQQASQMQKSIAPDVYGGLALNIEPERFRTELSDNSIIKNNRRIQSLLKDKNKIELFRQLTLGSVDVAFMMTCVNGYSSGISGSIRFAS